MPNSIHYDKIGQGILEKFLTTVFFFKEEGRKEQGKYYSSSLLVTPTLKLIRPFPTPISATEQFMAKVFLLEVPNLSWAVFPSTAAVLPSAPCMPALPQPQTKPAGTSFRVVPSAPRLQGPQEPTCSPPTSPVLKISAPP